MYIVHTQKDVVENFNCTKIAINYHYFIIISSFTMDANLKLLIKRDEVAHGELLHYKQTDYLWAFKRDFFDFQRIIRIFGNIYV